MGMTHMKVKSRYRKEMQSEPIRNTDARLTIEVSNNFEHYKAEKHHIKHSHKHCISRIFCSPHKTISSAHLPLAYPQTTPYLYQLHDRTSEAAARTVTAHRLSHCSASQMKTTMKMMSQLHSLLHYQTCRRSLHVSHRGVGPVLQALRNRRTHLAPRSA